MQVFSFDAFAQLGAERPSSATPPQPEDLCTIMYTSGTTDKPKVSLWDTSHKQGILKCESVHGPFPPLFCTAVHSLRTFTLRMARDG